jgi:hypothetical protein
MAKFENYRDYSVVRLATAEKALLTAWDSLSAFSNDLVLVGGLATKYLTKPVKEGQFQPVTIDVDFGVTIGVSSSWYPSIKSNLSAHGFEWKGQRFQKDVDGLDLYIDLLTDDGVSACGTVAVDDGLAVSVIPGVGRALECNRLIRVSGQNMIGAEVEQMVRVAEVGPMLVLKLNAFGGPEGRKAGKDVHDVMHLVLDSLDGTTAAVKAFRDEVKVGNRGAPYALNCLQKYFDNPEAQGPMACAAFRMNQEHLRPERAEESLMLRQQCVTLANELLRDV